MPFTLSEAADSWIGIYAEKQANDNLGDLDENMRLDPNLNSNLRYSTKNPLKDILKERYLDDPPSQGMAAIIDAIVHDCLLNNAMPG